MEFMAVDLPIEDCKTARIKLGESKFACTNIELRRRLGWTYELTCKIDSQRDKCKNNPRIF